MHLLRLWYSSISRYTKAEYPMALSIKSDEVDRLAREVAARAGESITEAIRIALLERLERQQVRGRASLPLRRQLQAIRKRCAALPVVDARPADEILGYDQRGVPR